MSKDIPLNCPICGLEFQPLEDYVDTHYYGEGYRSMLHCSRCNYKKVLNYQTYEDIENSMLEEAYEDDVD